MMRELLTTAASVAALTFALPGWAPAVFGTGAAAILPDAALAPAPDDTDLDDQPPRNQPRRGLKYDGLVRAGNEGRCANGFRLAHGDACTHGPDPAPAGVDVTAAGAPDPLVFAPGEEPRVQCDGDGESGARVQVIYARYSDVPDRYAEYADSIRQWAADASRIVGDSAAETGGQRHIRFVHDGDCRLDVADESLSLGAGDWFGQLQTRGYDRADRKYLVFFDEHSYCGIAFPPGFDDTDAPSNRHNTGGDFGRVDTACWNGRIAAHELVHLLGGVQLSAPHSTGAYHCTDEWDQLCYRDISDAPLTYDCADQAHNALLDCNHDDYFHTDPTRGSYLDTHWNVADSAFLAGFVRIASGPAGPTMDPSPTFTFAADQPDVTYECRLEGPGGTGAPYQPCVSPQSHPDLADGDYTFEVRALDPGGATDMAPARAYFAVDTVLPDTSIDSGPEGTTTDPTLVFAFSTDQPGASFRCRLDGPGDALGTFVPCTSPTTYHDFQVPDGDYTFAVRAVDPAGNVDPTPPSRTFTVDAPAPQTYVNLVCTVLSCETFRDSTPTFTFDSNEPEASFACRLDGPGSTTANWAACTSPVTYGPLADGAYTFAVRATDSSGATDPTPATSAYTVDTIAPQTTIDSGPAGPTSDPTSTFTFSASEVVAQYECSLDGAYFAQCSSPYTTQALGDGAHTLRVRSVDWAINTDPTPAVRNFIVDTVVPETTIDSGPSGTTTEELTTFTFSASEPGVGFECRLAGPGQPGGFAPCASPRTYDLPSGDYTFEVRASDAAGNTDATPASRSLAVAAPPQTTIDTAPPAATSSATATLVFSSDEPGSTFECRLEGPGSVAGGYEACTSPRTWTGLADGMYAVEVRATASGVTDPTPARHAWTVDTVAPETVIDSEPSGPITDDTPTFTFSTDEPGSAFECRVDGAAYTRCASPYTTDPLSDGVHTVEVRAVDAAGNADPTPAVRELSGVHEWGYAEAYHLLTGEPRLQRSRNSAGLQNSIASTGTGSYTVMFPGLGRSGGVVQVTASGSERRYCKVADWATGGGGLAAQVRCFAPDGSPANARFAIGYARAGAVLPGTRFAYLVANAPGALRTYNASGAANELIRNSVGRYQVRLPDVGGPGAVKITGYGAGSDTCTLVDWYPSGSVEVVEVACHNAGGAAVDAAFALTFHGPKGVLGVRTTGSGRAWVRSDNPTASSYTPGPNDRFNSTGGTDTIVRTGTGSYQVRLHGLATAFGTAHVTGVSRTGTSIRCQASWSSDAADELVSVSCFDRRGHAVNARFVMTFVD